MPIKQLELPLGINSRAEAMSRLFADHVLLVSHKTGQIETADLRHIDPVNALIRVRRLISPGPFRPETIAIVPRRNTAEAILALIAAREGSAEEVVAPGIREQMLLLKPIRHAEWNRRRAEYAAAPPIKLLKEVLSDEYLSKRVASRIDAAARLAEAEAYVTKMAKGRKKYLPKLRSKLRQETFASHLRGGVRGAEGVIGPYSRTGPGFSLTEHLSPTSVEVGEERLKQVLGANWRTNPKLDNWNKLTTREQNIITGFMLGRETHRGFIDALNNFYFSKHGFKLGTNLQCE